MVHSGQFQQKVHQFRFLSLGDALRNTAADATRLPAGGNCLGGRWDIFFSGRRREHALDPPRRFILPCRGSSKASRSAGVLATATAERCKLLR